MLEEGRVLKTHKEKHKEGGEFLKSAVYELPLILASY